jgi:hypothetical protein
LNALFDTKLSRTIPIRDNRVQKAPMRWLIRKKRAAGGGLVMVR